MIPYKEVTSEKSIRLQIRRSSFSPNSAMPYMSALIVQAKLQKRRRFHYHVSSFFQTLEVQNKQTNKP